MGLQDQHYFDYLTANDLDPNEPGYPATKEQDLFGVEWLDLA